MYQLSREQGHRVRSRIAACLCLAALIAAPSRAAAAGIDPVLEWMRITNDTVIAGGANSTTAGRQMALVSAAVFDAVNGIDRGYKPFFVTEKAPRPASERAAAIQAAYVILARLYPAKASPLAVQRDASIAGISSGPGGEHEGAIQTGIAWGQYVADGIWSWRATDGFDPNPAPPFLGVLGRPVAGVWRPTPRADGGTPASGSGPQFATMTPWVMQRASQFRPPAPYASPVTGQLDLTSAQYLADYAEAKTMGAYAGPRSADQSELALFWAGNTPLFWNRIAAQVSANRQLSLEENAHLFALLNLAMADANIACWDAKYRYVLWRPITAVREGSLDPDPAWKPWLDFFPAGTPSHPEYPSGHSTLSGAAATVLAATFGDDTPFDIDSEVRPGVRAFPSFSSALAEIHNARVFGGIHWRTACLVGSAVGKSVAEYVMAHAMQSRHEADGDQGR